MRRLPSLAAIEAFVQVARLGSIKAAAEELSLSSPALSRRIQSLEAFVGRPLFERGHQSIRLNDDGEELMALVVQPIEMLGDAIETMTSRDHVMRLRLGVPSLFASQRLIPHFPAMRKVHPQLHIDLDTAAMEQRLKDFKHHPMPGRDIPPGYMRRYVRLVTSAAKGAHLG